MTIEEIERTLQTVAENQAQLTADVQKLTGANRILEEAATLHQQVLRDHEARQARLEESFQRLIELASTTDGRLDAMEEAQVHTDSRLDALIDSQIQLTHRVDSLIASQVKTDEQLKTIGEQIGALTAAQARTDERINELFDRNGQKS